MESFESKQKKIQEKLMQIEELKSEIMTISNSELTDDEIKQLDKIVEDML